MEDRIIPDEPLFVNSPVLHFIFESAQHKIEQRSFQIQYLSKLFDREEEVVNHRSRWPLKKQTGKTKEAKYSRKRIFLDRIEALLSKIYPSVVLPDNSQYSGLRSALGVKPRCDRVARRDLC